MTYSLTCEVHDGAAKLELTGVVDLEPVGDRRIAEAPGDSSPVASDLEATETVWSRMRQSAMAYRPLRRFVQKMAVVSGSQLIDQVRSARNYSSADGLPKRVAKIWIESRN